ncbi:MAG: DUF1501 domain-containing protein [Pirellulales bacterium]|nr:DUF1501 domain-containing protein [Pirellulales bacterium]
MLELTGQRFRCCDAIPRRSVLRAGFLGLGALSLPDLLRARAQAARNEATAPRGTSVIFLELAGGPSHFETYDPKPDAPREYRGPLGVVPTVLAGEYFSEMFAAQAKIASRLAVVRSITHDSSSHETSAHLTQTGYYLRDRQAKENEMPSAGSIAAWSRQDADCGLPQYVALPRMMRSGEAAFLGKGFNPFETVLDANHPKFKVNNLTLAKGVDASRLADRRALLAAFDEGRRVVDRRGVGDSLDQFTAEAFEMVTGPAARRAFDLAKESPEKRESYGQTATGQNLLLARRLVEAGVAFVTVRIGGWDDHRDLAKRLRPRAAEYDRAVAALVDDLYERSLDRDVLVVAMGEFGRTPRFNKTAGRDHWGAVMSVLLAGGGLKVGQIVGSSNRKGEMPASAPYRPEHVLATVYRHLGIDTHQTFTDHQGRPRYVLERHEVIAELV